MICLLHNFLFLFSHIIADFIVRINCIIHSIKKTHSIYQLILTALQVIQEQRLSYDETK